MIRYTISLVTKKKILHRHDKTNLGPLQSILNLLENNNEKMFL